RWLGQETGRNKTSGGSVRGPAATRVGRPATTERRGGSLAIRFRQPPGRSQSGERRRARSAVGCLVLGRHRWSSWFFVLGTWFGLARAATRTGNEAPRLSKH